MTLAATDQPIIRDSGMTEAEILAQEAGLERGFEIGRGYVDSAARGAGSALGWLVGIGFFVLWAFDVWRACR